MSSEISRLSASTRITAFKIFITNFGSDNGTNSVMFKKENFRTAMRLSASEEGQFSIIFVVITITFVVVVLLSASL